MICLNILISFALCLNKRKKFTNKDVPLSICLSPFPFCLCLQKRFKCQKKQALREEQKLSGGISTKSECSDDCDQDDLDPHHRINGRDSDGEGVASPHSPGDMGGGGGPPMGANPHQGALKMEPGQHHPADQSMSAHTCRTPNCCPPPASHAQNYSPQHLHHPGGSTTPGANGGTVTPPGSIGSISGSLPSHHPSLSQTPTSLPPQTHMPTSDISAHMHALHQRSSVAPLAPGSLAQPPEHLHPGMLHLSAHSPGAMGHHHFKGPGAFNHPFSINSLIAGDSKMDLKMYDGMQNSGYPNYSSLTPLSAASNSPPSALSAADSYYHAAMSYGPHSTATTAL
jgi:hypothetical protein